MHDITGIGDWQSVRIMLPDGDAGTRDTLPYIKQLVQEGIEDPLIRRTAVNVCRAYGVPSGDKWGEYSAIFEWLRTGGGFDFRDDLVDREYLQPARALLESRAGDCDDLNTILAPALLGSIGFHSRAVPVKASHEKPTEFSHIYSEILIDGQWVPFDVARPDAAFGRAPEVYWDRWNYPLTEGAAGFGFLQAYYGAGMGDDSADLDAALAAAPSIESGAAQIVAAANNGQYLYSNQPLNEGLPVGQNGVVATLSSSNPSWVGMLLLAIAVVGLLATVKTK
jgi:Transglutaminase-like superfamily